MQHNPYYRHIFKHFIPMVNQKDANKILNGGAVKYSPEEIIEIRDFLYALAQIEFESYVNSTTKQDISI
jgi:hypothetical protein